MDKISMKSSNHSGHFGISRSQFLFCAMSAFSFALILRNPDIAIEYMKNGLSLCADTVIPSLFPFMVISELLVASGAGEILGRLLSKPMRLLFGISGAASCAFILGTICGFPVGAKTAVSLYDRGDISKSELERVITFSNIPGSAFLSSTVGVSLFADRTVGYAMFAAVFISAVAVGFVGKFIHPGNSVCPAQCSDKNSGDGRKFGIRDFTDSISKAAFGMLTVCAFVVFFSAFVGTLGILLSSLSPSDTFSAFTFGFFEMTAGVSATAKLADRRIALLICAFICGWSGLSVHFQIMSVCTDKNRGISFFPFFISKLVQGFLCTAIMYLYVTVINPSIAITVDAIGSRGTAFAPMPYIIAVNIAFALTVTLILIDRKLKKRNIYAG